MSQEKTFEAVVEGLGSSGEGFVSWNGTRLYMPYVLPGEKVRAEAISANRAALLHIIQESPNRRKAPCRHFMECGGCSLQQFSESFYKEFKTRVVTDAISNAGYEAVPEMHFMGEKARRRVSFKVDSVNSQLGFFKPDSNTLVDIDQCLIIRKDIFSAAMELKRNIKKFGDIKEVIITEVEGGLDVFFRSNGKPSGLDFISSLQNTVRVSWNGKIIHGVAEINFSGVRIALPPEYFLQPTREGQEKITSIILENIKGKKVADLFSGLGSYSFPLVMAGYKIHAVEQNKEMVDSMLVSISKNNLSGKIFVEEKNLDKEPLSADDELRNFDVVVLNPPRTGALRQVKELAKSRVKRIIMVSCSPLTFARDAGILYSGGYILKKIVGIDQFVYSPHLEIVGVFEK